MRGLLFLFIASLLTACSLGCSSSSTLSSVSPQEKGGVGDITGPYQIPDPKWPQWAHPYPKQGYIWGSQGGVFAESPNRIYFANRGELKLPEKMPLMLQNVCPGLAGFYERCEFPGFWGAFVYSATNEPIANMENVIVIVDGNGKLIESWNQWDKLFEFGRGPHSIYISPYDPDRRVWVVDDFRHCIFIFSHDGKQLLQTLGVPGEWGDNDDLTHFHRPTSIDWFKDGTFLVSDGYSNTRIVTMDKTGKPIMKWGTRGKGPGQFDSPHGVAVGGGNEDRVYVSDRGNARIQVFDPNGKFIEEWPGIQANQLMVSANGQNVWAVDLRDDRVVEYDLGGHIVQAWGQSGQKPGYTWCMHQFSADSDGNLYTAECFNGRQDKFVPKPGVDPARLVHPRPLMPMANPSN
jgi:sugar lactone lactonase YvrE